VTLHLIGSCYNVVPALDQEAVQDKMREAAWYLVQPLLSSYNYVLRISAPFRSESPLAKVRCDVRMNWKGGAEEAHGEVVGGDESVELVAFIVTQHCQQQPCYRLSEQARLSSEMFLCYLVNIHSHGIDFEADLFPSRQLIGFFL
jgi:hypothetical protein